MLLMNPSDNALIIFVRNTEKGKVKTRLAKDLGDDKALQVYEYLLQYTADLCMDLHCHRFVFYSNYVHLNDRFDDACFGKYLQEGKDLGERMRNAFDKVFDLGHKNICIIGSDCYDLQPTHLEDAFLSLKSNDTVIGPSEDGGFYLLGMNKMYPSLFSEKAWGTETMKEIERLQLSNMKLPMLNDIDTLEDLLATDVLAKCKLEP
jgi:uncharacterized protein